MGTIVVTDIKLQRSFFHNYKMETTPTHCQKNHTDCVIIEIL